MIKFDNYPDQGRSFGGNAGSKLDIEMNGERWIVKTNKNTKGMNRVEISYTTSALSEYLGSHIYNILGVESHETVLGILNDRLVVACKNFNDYQKHIELVEYRQIRNNYTKELSEHLENDLTPSDALGHGTNLEEVIIHLEHNPTLLKVKGIKEKFWDMVIIDLLIKNNDRNSGNWGILTNYSNIYKFAPVYDNGSSFSNKLSDSQMKEILSNSERFYQSALHNETGYHYKGKNMFSTDILQIKNKDLSKAIKRNVPNIIRTEKEIYSFIDSIPTEENGIKIISDIQKEFYKKGIHTRLNRELIPAYKCISKMVFQNEVEEATAKQEAERTAVDSKQISKGITTPEK